MAIFHTDVTPPEGAAKRTQLEALAARYGVRLDGVFDSRTAKMLVVRAALGELPLDRQSDAYLDSAIEALAGGAPAAGAGGKPEQRIDSKAAEEKFRKATEDAWRNPSIGARADMQFGVDVSRVTVGPRSAAFGAPVDPSNLRDLPLSADETFRKNTENAWRRPSVGTSASEVIIGPHGASFASPTATPPGPGPAPAPAAKQVPPLDEAARAKAHLEALENAWKNPTVGVTVV